jgi:putative addiction module component (TIGR02574 family)
MNTVDQITSQILQLSFADRHALVEQLNAFVDEESRLNHQLAEEADIALMEQRLDDFLAGKIKSVPWEKALEELRGTLKK